ncbi:MAG: dihydropteroate synthase [Bacteroidales bacterium]|nr:dihydropteroate synthase [Bacteroidales bacterium]
MNMSAPSLMGIVNLTDNSFVAGDRMGGLAVSDVVAAVGRMLSEGASIVDIGACSTAPGNVPVSVKEELARMEKYLPSIFSAFPQAVFSIDSFRPEVVGMAYEIAQGRLGKPECQLWVNDISSGDELMDFAAARKLTYVAMSRAADPFAFFCEFARRAERTGLVEWVLDPGFGFGKTMEQNWDILNNLQRLKEFARPILVALSRKRMIYDPLGLTPENCAVQSVEAELLAASKGASIIRTHDLTLYRQLSSDCR